MVENLSLTGKIRFISSLEWEEIENLCVNTEKNFSDMEIEFSCLDETSEGKPEVEFSFTYYDADVEIDMSGCKKGSVYYDRAMQQWYPRGGSWEPLIVFDEESIAQDVFERIKYIDTSMEEIEVSINKVKGYLQFDEDCEYSETEIDEDFEKEVIVKLRKEA